MISLFWKGAPFTSLGVGKQSMNLTGSNQGLLRPVREGFHQIFGLQLSPRFQICTACLVAIKLCTSSNNNSCFLPSFDSSSIIARGSISQPAPFICNKTRFTKVEKTYSSQCMETGYRSPSKAGEVQGLMLIISPRSECVIVQQWSDRSCRTQKGGILKTRLIIGA